MNRWGHVYTLDASPCVNSVDVTPAQVSVSIGIVDCEFECSFTMNELSLRVAEIKKYAKRTPGNAYVRDRRAALGSKSHGEKGGEGMAYFHARITITSFPDGVRAVSVHVR